MQLLSSSNFCKYLFCKLAIEHRVVFPLLLVGRVVSCRGRVVSLPGLVVVAGAEAFTAVAAGVAPTNTSEESARRVVSVVSLSTSKLFFVRKLPKVRSVGIGLDVIFKFREAPFAPCPP